MEKKSLLKNVYSIILILIGFSVIILLSSTTTMPNENNNLMLNKLNDKLINIEEKIMKLTEYNNQVYFQIMGIDIDTIENSKSLDNLGEIPTDSIFRNLDERSIKASQIMSSQLNKLADISNNLKKNSNLVDYYPTISPIKTGDFVEITSSFGWSKHPIYKKPIFHQGVDISAKYYTTILSTINGYVSKVVYSRYGYGNKIIIKNAQGFEILFAHMNTISVKKGQFVKKGQTVGTVGSTGLSTGAHLHYEIRKNDKLKDPLAYFYTYLTNQLIAENVNYTN